MCQHFPCPLEHSTGIFRTSIRLVWDELGSCPAPNPKLLLPSGAKWHWYSTACAQPEAFQNAKCSGECGASGFKTGYPWSALLAMLHGPLRSCCEFESFLFRASFDRIGFVPIVRHCYEWTFRASAREQFMRAIWCKRLCVCYRRHNRKRTQTQTWHICWQWQWACDWLVFVWMCQAPWLMLSLRFASIDSLYFDVLNNITSRMECKQEALIWARAFIERKPTKPVAYK